MAASSIPTATMSSRAADAERLRQQLRMTPTDRIAWHNLAAAEGDLGRVAEAEAAARRAIALGLEAPETRLVLARALQSQRRLDDAEKLFRILVQKIAVKVDPSLEVNGVLTIMMDEFIAGGAFKKDDPSPGQ